MVGGRRVKTVDVHSHCVVPGIMELMGQKTPANAALIMSTDRVPQMDAQGIDLEVLSINPFWYAVERELARRLIAMQNEKLSAFCAAHPDRFAGLATVALQHPDLAAEQLEEGMKKLGLRGVSIGASVNGEELASNQVRSVLGEGGSLARADFHPPAGRAGAAAAAGQRAPDQRDWQPAGHDDCALAPDLRGHAGSISRAQDLRGARRRLPAVVRGPIGSRLPHLPRAMHQAAQEAADRIPEAALFRFAGVHAARLCGISLPCVAPVKSCWGPTIRIRGRPRRWITSSARRD